MRSARRRGVRAGFALPVSIMALVLLSTLVVGALFIATEELRAGRSDAAEQRALAAAELALERAIGEWDASRNTALRVGSTQIIARRSTDAGDSVDVAATRVQRRGVWIVADASAADGRLVPARRVVGASLRLVGPLAPLRAALTARGRVTVIDGGVIDGRDTSVPSMRTDLCADPASTPAAAIAVSDSSRVCGSECGAGAPAGVSGDPAIAIAGAPSDSATTPVRDGFGTSVSSRATIILDAGTFAPRPTGSAECDVGDRLNWGDPTGATRCADHFPVIRVRGAAVLAAGSVGQGVLLVDGDLELEAGARFFGVVSVADDIVVRGAGAEIVGVAFAADVDGADGVRVADGGAIRFASCAARLAMLGASRLARTPTRWWTELR